MSQSTRKSFAQVPRACFQGGNIAALVSKAGVVWEIPAMSPPVSFKMFIKSGHTLRILVTEFIVKSVILGSVHKNQNNKSKALSPNFVSVQIVPLTFSPADLVCFGRPQSESRHTRH